MIGIDLIEVDRLDRALERRPRLAERVFSEGELAYARSRKRPAMHLAARFAAKEAALKALGIGGRALRGAEGTGGAPRAPARGAHGPAAGAPPARTNGP